MNPKLHSKTNVKRLEYLDIAKGIGIILVVLGHSTFLSDPLLTWIASFHMPLFFIVSGMLIRHTQEENKDIKYLLKHKSKGIMLPYLSFSLIYLLIDFLYLWLKPENMSIVEIERGAIETATLYGISVLWFLPALFFGECAFLFVRKHQSHGLTVTLGFVLAVLVSVLQPLFDTHYPLYKNMPVLWIGYFITVLFRSAAAFSFLTFGYYIHPYLQKERSTRNQFSGRAKSVLLALGLFICNIAISMKNGRVDLHTLVFNNPWLYFIGAASGSLALILLCRSIKSCRPLAYLGVNSLIIMLTHLDCRVMIMAINTAYWINQFVTRAKVYVLYLCVGIAVTLLELALVYLFNHYFYFLIGKKRPLTIVRMKGEK